MFTYIKSDTNFWTVVLKCKSYQFDETHLNYAALVECIKSDNEEEFIKLYSIVPLVKAWVGEDFSCEGGVVQYKGDDVDPVISDRILKMIEEGFDHKPMLRFLENLYLNPSYRAIKELYNFLKHNHLPITPDGYFLAYKAVKSDFKDKYTGEIDNSVGSTPKMKRYMVDDNANAGCSQGLHVGDISYVTDYATGSDKIVICKVNPANVVSVPTDSDCKKVRCCEYEVVAIYEKTFEDSVHEIPESQEYEF